MVIGNPGREAFHGATTGNVLENRLCQAQAHSAQRGTKLPALKVTSADGRVSARVLRGHRTFALDDVSARTRILEHGLK
eukprot:7457-Pelagomonas_calceolata.AAC.1